MSLKQKLDYHYRYFDKSQISPDPLEYLHLYSNENDIELIGFISSIFAYGNVQQIKATLDKIILILGEHPAEFIAEYNIKKDAKRFASIIHRFYTTDDITGLFLILNNVIKNYGSLKELFLMYYFDEDKNLKNALSFLSNNLLNIYHHYSGNNPAPGLSFMFPDPAKGSACKRMNLFLRWMVRKDELDFGIWSEIKPAQLVIPVDTHVARICRNLKLTRIKNVSWKMAEDITDHLRKYDPVDPVKYDFAICHIGMRKMEW